jgi:hypothetical protein
MALHDRAIRAEAKQEPDLEPFGHRQYYGVNPERIATCGTNANLFSTDHLLDVVN